MQILDFESNKNFSGIYQIRNIVNNKLYIGSTIKKLRERKSVHFHLLKNFKHENKKLQNSYNKHGKNNFIFEILEVCSKEKIIEREQFYIDLFNSVNLGYNIFPFARSGAGIKLTEEHKKKLSNSHKGHVHSNVTKNKMSLSQKGKIRTIEHKEKCRISKLGNKNPMSKLTKEQVIEIKRKYSINKKIKILCEEFKVANTTIQSIVYGKTWKNV